jgi:NitT/TauT family transport system ATP-binding protein
MSAAPLVDLQSVSKRYGESALILDRLTLHATAGDFLGVIGPSGCGKSTLLRLIAGLSPVSSGELTVNGKAPGGDGAETAFVFQEPTLLPWSTVAQNVELPHRLRGTAAAERVRVREAALSLVGLSDRADAYPRQLSGGQKMRVSLARAITLAPKLLLLDEPFGALDEMTRERLNEELLLIRERQRWAAFFVTHSVAEAVFLSNRVLVMSAHPGAVRQEIPIPLPYPRTADTRLLPAYQQLVAEVSRTLRSVEKAA